MIFDISDLLQFRGHSEVWIEVGGHFVSKSAEIHPKASTKPFNAFDLGSVYQKTQKTKISKSPRQPCMYFYQNLSIYCNAYHYRGRIRIFRQIAQFSILRDPSNRHCGAKRRSQLNVREKLSDTFRDLARPRFLS